MLTQACLLIRPCAEGLALCLRCRRGGAEEAHASHVSSLSTAFLRCVCSLASHADEGEGFV